MEDLREQVYEMANKFTEDAHEMIDKIVFAAQVGEDISSLRRFVLHMSDNYLNLIKTASRLTGTDLFVAHVVELCACYNRFAEVANYASTEEVSTLKMHFDTMCTIAKVIVA